MFRLLTRKAKVQLLSRIVYAPAKASQNEELFPLSHFVLNDVLKQFSNFGTPGVKICVCDWLCDFNMDGFPFLVLELMRLLL